MIDSPAGHTWEYRAPARSGRTRGVWIVTAPNGTRVSFYDDGGVRVYRPDHGADVGTADRAESGTNVDIEFAPRP